jgi:hypothetical protein
VDVVREEAVRVLPSGLISRADFARFIGRPEATLAQWAWRRLGPRPVKVGGRVYYKFAEVQRFANGESTSPEGAAE